MWKLRRTVQHLFFRLLTLILIIADVCVIIIDLISASKSRNPHFSNTLVWLSLIFSLYFVAEVSMRIVALGYVLTSKRLCSPLQRSITRFCHFCGFLLIFSGVPRFFQLGRISSGSGSTVSTFSSLRSHSYLRSWTSWRSATLLDPSSTAKRVHCLTQFCNYQTTTLLPVRIIVICQSCRFLVIIRMIRAIRLIRLVTEKQHLETGARQFISQNKRR